MKFSYTYFFLATILFFSVSSSFAQVVITGTILDAHTKEPVTYASVYVKRTGVGNTSDSAGNFRIVVNSLKKDSLVVSYVGYALFIIAVRDSNNNLPINIQLQRGGLTNNVIIKAKFNKGLFLWRKIMSKKKQYNRYNLSNFGYEAYNKLEVDVKNFKVGRIKKNPLLKPFTFVLENIDSTSEKDPFLPAYLLESISDYGYQKNPKKFYENIRASNTKGFKNESISKLTGVMNQNINVYGNFVNVMDKDFIGPFNDNADDYYSFSVPDTQTFGEKKIYHFVFRPKRPGQNTFEGDAWVFAQTWQIQKVSLYLGKDANINFIDRISVFQEFIPVNDSIYFLNRDKFFADFRVLGKQSLTLIGRKSTSYRNIIINNDSINNFFKEQKIEEIVKTNDGLTNVTDSAWSGLRHDSLSVNEKAIYTTIDKLLQMPKFQKLERTLKFLGSGYKNIGNLEIGPWFNWISGNMWEGTRFRFDLGTNTGFNKHIYLHGYLAYGTTDKKLKGLAEAFWILKKSPRLRLHAAYSNDIDNGISQIGEVSQDNIFSLAIRKPNVNRKFIQTKEVRFEVFKEWGKAGFSTELFLAHHAFTPLQNLPFKSNFPTTEGAPLTSFEVALKLRWAYLETFIQGDYFRYSLGTKYPVVEIMATKGIKGITGSAYDYTKLSASIKDKVKISPYGSFSYKLYAGKVFGTLPFTFLENHPGNDIYYYNGNVYNLMNRFEYLSDQYAGINIEHNIGSGLFRFIPLTRKLKWRQFWNAKSLWGSLSDANATLNDAKNTFKTLNSTTYLEVGTGIDNIFKLLRLDFVWRLSQTPGTLAKTARFGIFGSFQFQF
ncbi:MAG: carboxypeptidase-like regulatory domain-containing protein [Ferruginibacter sp.]|nr:carboxypeptidase-like regulatory domain-containing protein [Ferruginibacter sp.]